MKSLTSDELRNDPRAALKAATTEHVVILEAGRPVLVLLSFEEFTRLSSLSNAFLEEIGKPDGVAEIELDIPRSHEIPRAADFDE
jgi:prevent-host-death family protein